MMAAAAPAENPGMSFFPVGQDEPLGGAPVQQKIMNGWSMRMAVNEPERSMLPHDRFNGCLIDVHNFQCFLALMEMAAQTVPASR